MPSGARAFLCPLMFSQAFLVFYPLEEAGHYKTFNKPHVVEVFPLIFGNKGGNFFIGDGWIMTCMEVFSEKPIPIFFALPWQHYLQRAIQLEFVSVSFWARHWGTMSNIAYHVNSN